MNLTQKKPIIFSDIQGNEFLNYGNEFQTFMTQMFRDSFGNEVIENDNFAYILVQILSWMKQYYNQISISLVESDLFKIKIDNSIGEESVKYFSKLFNALSLYRLTFNYNDLSNEWFSFIKF